MRIEGVDRTGSPPLSKYLTTYSLNRRSIRSADLDAVEVVGALLGKRGHPGVERFELHGVLRPCHNRGFIEYVYND